MHHASSLRLSASFVLACALVPQEAATRPAQQTSTAAGSRVVAAKAVLDSFTDERAPDVPIETRCAWSARLAAAEVEASPDRAVDALKDHLARMIEIEKVARALMDAGRATRVDVRMTEYFRVEAESWVQKKQMR